MVLCNKLTVSAWNAHDLFYRLNNERRYKLDDPDVIKYLDSDIIGIVETKACETDNISLNGYTLLSKTKRPMISKGIYGGVAVLCKTSISKGIAKLPITLRIHMGKTKEVIFQFSKRHFYLFHIQFPQRFDML